MAQTGRSNVRYVDPQRRYTVVLGPSWNAPFEALPTTTALEHTTVPMDDGIVCLHWARSSRSVDNGMCFPRYHLFQGQAAIWYTRAPFSTLAIPTPQSRSQALPNRGALASGRVRGVLRGQGSQFLRCGISTPMTAVGQKTAFCARTRRRTGFMQFRVRHPTPVL
jgi:hypothetical protein